MAQTLPQLAAHLHSYGLPQEVDGYHPTVEQVSKARARKRTIDGFQKRLLVEYCCSHDSLLGDKTEIAEGCTVLRLTEREDMTSESGMRYALRSMKRFRPARVMVWSSIPCTGGSAWQRVNEALYRCRNDTDAFQPEWAR